MGLPRLGRQSDLAFPFPPPYLGLKLFLAVTS